jgi:hypothetical protein
VSDSELNSAPNTSLKMNIGRKNLNMLPTLFTSVWCAPFLEYPFNSTFTGKSIDENYEDIRGLFSLVASLGWNLWGGAPPFTSFWLRH